MSTADVVVWKAMACAMFAWHLQDWVKNEFGITNERIKELLKTCPSIEHMRAIATGSKHCHLRDQSSYSIVDSRHQPGGFDRRAFSRGFETPRLLIETADGTELDFDDELKEARKCWRDFFKTNLAIAV